MNTLVGQLVLSILVVVSLSGSGCEPGDSKSPSGLSALTIQKGSDSEIDAPHIQGDASMEDELRRLVRDAIRNAYSTMRTEHADESFYAFALQTDCDVSTVTCVANSKEAMMRQAEESGDLEWIIEEFGDGADLSGVDVFAHHDPEVKWVPAEWAYWDEQKIFEPVNRLLREYRGEDGKENIVAHKNRVLQMFGLALQDLRDDGTFGGDIALIVSVADYGPDEAKPMEQIIKRLNKDTIYKDLISFYDNL